MTLCVCVCVCVYVDTSAEHAEHDEVSLEPPSETTSTEPQTMPYKAQSSAIGN